MSSAFRVAFVFFLLLSALNVPGYFILRSLSIPGPSDLKDVIVLPLVASITLALLLHIKWKINKGILFALVHISFWSVLIIIDHNSADTPNCIDCPSAEYLLNLLTPTVCSLFLLINHWVWTTSVEFHWQETFVTYGVNLLLMGLYLFAITNLARYIVTKFTNRFLSKKSDHE